MYRTTGLPNTRIRVADAPAGHRRRGHHPHPRLRALQPLLGGTAVPARTRRRAGGTRRRIHVVAAGGQDVHDLRPAVRPELLRAERQPGPAGTQLHGALHLAHGAPAGHRPRQYGLLQRRRTRALRPAGRPAAVARKAPDAVAVGAFRHTGAPAARTLPDRRRTPALRRCERLGRRRPARLHGGHAGRYAPGEPPLRAAR